MGGKEKKQLLTKWNQTEAEYPKDKTIHQLFEEQVKRTSEQIAVVFEEYQLTYNQLNEKSNQLAHYLRKSGVKPDSLVAVSLERSLELTISLLGILKAGGAYVPLDPAYPEDRLRFMLEDSQSKILITNSLLKEKFKALSCEKILLDTIDLSLNSDKNLHLMNKSTDLAYVIYTSGSTGKPKGVANEHTAVVNRLNWMQKIYQLTEKDRILQKTSFSFDVSVWEFFWPLLNGAKLVIANPGVHQDPFQLQKAIKLNSISVMHFVPSMLHVFLQTLEKNNTDSLRLVITSGEALSYSVKEKCLALLPQAQLDNLYGPTEAAIDVTYWNCREKLSSAIVPIGKPIDNIKLYILDNHRQLVPVGIFGELYIGGVGVARGYLNREDLTQEKFIENPFSTEEDKKQGENLKLYRTGDLVRYLPDGNIEYLGRTDSQVKIRGFRIECEEIENILRSQPIIADAAVSAREDDDKDKQLVAYLVVVNKGVRLTDEKAFQTIELLRTVLSNQLPSYMVPSTFIYIDKLPLNVNGKLDRKALPKPEKIYRNNDKRVPQTEIEKQLAQIWADVLKIEKERYLPF